MTQVTLQGAPLSLTGQFPKIGDTLENFSLVTTDLKEVSLENFKGKTLVLNIFPSLDTPVCSSSVIKFNQQAAKLNNAEVLCISKDLPFAQARFCGAENISNVQTLSAFRNQQFEKQLGVGIIDGILKGLLTRAVLVLDPQGKVVYTELVPEISHSPNYEKCLSAIAALG